MLSYRWSQVKLNLCNVEHHLSLTVLLVGNVKINLTSLSTWDTNNFWDAFSDEIIVMASFIPTCFSSTMWFKVFSWAPNLNLCSSLLSKMLCINVPLTVQQFEHNALSPEFLGAAYYLNLSEASCLFRQCLKFIQLKSCVKSSFHYFYCLNGFTDNYRPW